MKQIILLLIFALLLSCNASKEISYNIYTPNLRGNDQIGYSLRLIYVGAENQIIIPNSDKLEISMSNGEIRKNTSRKNDSYYIKTTNFKPSELYIKNKSKVDTIVLTKRNIPSPSIYFNYNFLPKEISIIELQKINNRDRFTVLLPNFSHSCRFKLISFDIMKISRFNESKKIENNRPNSNQAIKLLKSGVNGDTFIFSNIKVKMEDTNEDELIIYGKNHVMEITL